MVSRRFVAVLIVAVLVGTVLAPAAASIASSPGTDSGLGAAPSDANVSVIEASQSDPPADRLGWENGYWYNESIDVTPENGLNDSELEAVVGRSMARVEQIRRLEFETTVSVEVVSRQEYRNRWGTNASTPNTSTANRLHQNVKWEALLSIGEDEDALAGYRSTQSATVGGFYSPGNEQIVIVSANESVPKMDEITLSQELFHALQDQQFNLSFDRLTEEGHNAGNGIVEGDANLVDQLYQQRCGAEWNCLQPGTGTDGSDSADDETDSDAGDSEPAINYGVYLTQYQPYSDGPTFVTEIRATGGWDAVNDIYENPPASTEQTIHPEKYPDEEPHNLTVIDTSADAWRSPDLGNGSAEYARFGQAGLSAMFMRPVFASSGMATPVVGPVEFYNYTDSGEVSSVDPLNYGLDVTDGWDNDRLYPYITNDSATTNETGYVWKTVWDSEGDAAEFAAGYTDLLAYYGAQPVDGHRDTYRIPTEKAFGDAFYLNQTGDQFVIVNAPTVSALSAVRAGAAPAVEETTTASNGTSAKTATASNGPMAETATTTSGPGFAVVGAVVSLLSVALLAVWRVRDAGWDG
ncbi:Hvo_1808 family surface protein [Halorhabdus salina]|uniref:Hvo_1808 family surface protein n=1 Tax=Halorhabdus salina TaxID=2750670 RepID=UPI0015EEFB61|nr:Hvo_1808 family surface protein [Halorhabdus salina]